MSSILFYSTRVRKKLKNPFFEIFLVPGKMPSAEKCKRGPPKSLITSMPSASSLYVVSGTQLIKLIKSVTSLVLKKKKKVTTKVCVFLRKAPTKKRKVTTIVCVFLRKAPTKNVGGLCKEFSVFKKIIFGHMGIFDKPTA